ncbi:MAG: hypothetical protein KA165_03590 [Saprospiraceae bacterium]|nr:hypothetical protein [Saprospiraceae bacterium]
MFSSLQQLIDQKKQVTTDELNLPENKPAAIELQSRLCDLGILDPIFKGDKDTPFGPAAKADGVIGPMTRNALFEFCKLAKIDYVDKLLPVSLTKALVSAHPDTFLPVTFDNKFGNNAKTRLAKRILRCLRAKNFWIARSPNAYNIVYIEGVNSDGNENADHFDEWNDRRFVIRIKPGGKPEIVINDQATTEPGKFYTNNPENAQGAARIAFGQYKAWVDGLHKGVQPALVQRAEVRVHRDLDKNGKRSKSDPVDVGDWFGINQHSTSPNVTPQLIGKYSAGCLVGQEYAAHLKFLSTVRKDFRYKLNKGYLFISAVIAGDDPSFK